MNVRLNFASFCSIVANKCSTQARNLALLQSPFRDRTTMPHNRLKPIGSITVSRSNTPKSSHNVCLVSSDSTPATRRVVVSGRLSRCRNDVCRGALRLSRIIFSEDCLKRNRRKFHRGLRWPTCPWQAVEPWMEMSRYFYGHLEYKDGSALKGALPCSALHCDSTDAASSGNRRSAGWTEMDSLRKYSGSPLAK